MIDVRSKREFDGNNNSKSAGGGVNINNIREADATRAVTTSDLRFTKHGLLRKGQKNYVVVTARSPFR